MIYTKVKFNLATAKKISDNILCGLIQTNSGNPVRIFAWDCKMYDRFPIVSAVYDPNTDIERISCYSNHGIKQGSTPEETEEDLILKVPIEYHEYADYKPKVYESCLVKAYNPVSTKYTWTIATCATSGDGVNPTFYANNGNRMTPDIVDYNQGFLPLNNQTMELYGDTINYEQLFTDDREAL